MRALLCVAVLVALAASEGLQSGDDCTTSLACPDSQFCQQFDDKPDNGICSLCASCHFEIDAFDGLCMEKCGMSVQPGTDGYDNPCTAHSDCPVGKVRGSVPEFCILVDHIPGTPSVCVSCAECQFDADAFDGKCPPRCDGIPKTKADL
jgi:hypothetical protein